MHLAHSPRDFDEQFDTKPLMVNVSIARSHSGTIEAGPATTK
jgi:hypothetical protein